MAQTKRRKTTLHAHPYYPQDKGKIERAIQKRNPRIHKPHQKIPPLAKQPPQQIQKLVQPPKNTPRHKNHTLHTIHHQTPRQQQKKTPSLPFSNTILPLSHLSKNHQNNPNTYHPKPKTPQPKHTPNPKTPPKPNHPNSQKKRTVALSTLLNKKESFKYV